MGKKSLEAVKDGNTKGTFMYDQDQAAKGIMILVCIMSIGIVSAVYGSVISEVEANKNTREVKGGVRMGIVGDSAETAYDLDVDYERDFTYDL